MVRGTHAVSRLAQAGEVVTCHYRYGTCTPGPQRLRVVGVVWWILCQGSPHARP